MIFVKEWKKTRKFTPGHKYDGLAVYDLDMRVETRLSGKGKPTGFVRVWF